MPFFEYRCVSYLKVKVPQTICISFETKWNRRSHMTAKLKGISLQKYFLFCTELFIIICAANYLFHSSLMQAYLFSALTREFKDHHFQYPPFSASFKLLDNNSLLEPHFLDRDTG